MYLPCKANTQRDLFSPSKLVYYVHAVLHKATAYWQWHTVAVAYWLHTGSGMHTGSGILAAYWLRH
jgi:hypothetical protein